MALLLLSVNGAYFPAGKIETETEPNSDFELDNKHNWHRELGEAIQRPNWFGKYVDLFQDTV